MNRILILWLFLQLANIKTFSQTTTTVSARCGKCAKAVSSSSKVGDRCPHCHVIWGRENLSTTNSKYQLSESSLPSKNSLSNPKSGVQVDKNKASKAETEQWILSKFSEYSKQGRHYEKSYDLFGKTTSDSFEDTYIYSFKSSGFAIDINSKESFSNKEERRTVLIPIYDVKGVVGAKSLIHIVTNSETIVTTKSNQQKNVSNVIQLGFNCDAETDIANRIQKAFNHLKTFYPKQKSNEPF